MITLSDFVRVCYAPVFFYGRLNIRTIDAYLQSVELYVKHVGKGKSNAADGLFVDLVNLTF